MNRLPIFLFLLQLVLLNQGTLVAQKSWTLDQCINYAWENNFTVHNQELGVKIRKTDYRQAKNELFPDLSFQTSYTQNFGRSIDPTTNSYIDVQFFNNGYGLSTSVDLFNGFMKLNTIDMQRLNYEAEKNKLQQVRNEVAFTVINSYFNVLLQQGLSAIALENFKLSRTQLDFTTEFVRLGRKPGTDLLETEANLASDSFLLVQSYNLLEQACLGLKYQMNFPVGDSLVIDTVVMSIFAGSIDTLSMEELYNVAATALPDLVYAKNNLLAAKKAVQVSKGNFSPRLGFYAGWNSQYMETSRDSLNRIIPFNDQMTNNASEYVSLGLQIPLFSRFSRYSSLSTSKLRYQQAKVQYDDISYKLKMGVEKSLTDWRAARAEYESSLSQLAKNLKAYDAAEKKLDKGLINIIEFYIQKNKWIRAKTEVLRTGLQVLLKERYIRFLMTGSLLSGMKEAED
ncbi:MAG: TolC family protein [Bacteroidales bacterium]|jgi:outer membrane protein TolC|nr:TolC family protein [Bacteroidales bacterium]